MRLLAEPDSPAIARDRLASVRALLDRPGAPLAYARWDDATLLLSELVTNAVHHARTEIDLDVQLLAGDILEIRVTDHMRALPQLRPADETGGRGLRIVAQLATDWGVEPSGDGKTVWCRLKLTDVR